MLIPEFPLRRGTLWGETTSSPNKSLKVDYLAFDASVSTAYFVELKTDQASRRPEQDKYLKRASEVGLHDLITGICTLSCATPAKYRQKYIHLLAKLARLGLVGLPEDPFQEAFPSPSDRLGSVLQQLRNLVESSPRMHVVYVQPIADDSESSIGFAEFANAIEGDPLGAQFASYLRAWQHPAATNLPNGGCQLNE